jgi:hypothetical protein
MLRLFFLIENMKYSSILNKGQSANILCTLNGIKNSDSFILRNWLDEHPVITLTAYSFIMVTFCSYFCYTFERNHQYQNYLDGGLDEPYVYHDYIWLVLITLLTVGYGDMYPETFSGRVVCILASFGGLILTATLVNIVNDKLGVSSSEKNVISLMRKE